MSERSPSPPSRVTKLFKARTRERRSAANSLKSETSDNSHQSHGVRGSVEGAIERLKGSTGSDEDDDSHDPDQSAGGIKKLIPKGLVSKRRRRKQSEASATEEAEAERGRSIANRGRLANDSDKSLTLSQDDVDELGNYNLSKNSLITIDSDPESPFETPPPLSTHPSHAGYLTTSSPLVQSSIIPETSHIHTFDGTTSKSADSINIVAASDSTASASDKLQAPFKPQKRSPSPVGRLKEKLTGRRGASPNPSPNRSPERNAGNAGLPAVQDKDNNNTGHNRRGSGSVVSRIFEKQGQQVGSVNSSPERPRRNSRPQPIDTNARPQTPPPGDKAAPLIVNTPPTPTDEQARRFATRDRRDSDPVPSSPDVVISPSGNMISHRRVRSNSAALGPSKLSNITSAPLTPTFEDAAITPAPGQGGFFSTVFSAAQNAANTLSNSIANTSVAPNGNKNKGGSTQELKDIVESPEVETLADKTNSSTAEGEKELAVKTLGMGDLSLSHLGITETASASTTPIASKFPDDARKRPEDNKFKNDLSTEDSFGRPSTAPVSAAEPLDHTSAPVIEDTTVSAPRSNYDPSAGDRTPPNGSVFEGRGAVHRSGSVRSAGYGTRRKRGSSAATGTTIGAAIVASHSSLTSPGGSTTPKVTGFAVASKKRNRDFHNLFRSVPEDDYLIEDYSCALQREILAHGRLYVSEGHLCFYSNIFGWVTTLVMSFDEIVSVEKRSTALLFKNGLMISTLHAKNVFASFTSRDSTYDLIVGIWKLGHPSLRSSLNGVSIEETGGGDKTEKYDGDAPVVAASQSGSDSESDEDGDEVYDEDEEDEDGMSFEQAEGSVAGSEVAEKVVSRKASGAVVLNGPAEKSKDDTPAAPVGDFPGPATHGPTSCADQAAHFPKVLADEVVPAPLGKIYSMMFGPGSIWMKNFLTVDQKCFELTMEGTNAQPLSLDNKVRNYTYIKPLSGAIGPKQTKCINMETLDALDLERAVSVTVSTQNPDVPSGNVFSVKTRYCLTWAENNATRIQINCIIEWTGKSWLKGPIEKGTNDGQTQYAKDLLAALKAGVSSRRPTATTGGKGKKKGRKSRESRNLNKTTDGAADPKPTADSWGLFEPLHGIFGPVVDILGPLLTGNILYGLLVGLLVASWFRYGFTGRGNATSSNMGFLSTPERVAAYEEMWRREESELWEWLEDRVGSGRLRDISKMPIEAKTTEERLRSEKMDEREIDAAIKVTEEKLKVLKESVRRKKGALGAVKAESVQVPIVESPAEGVVG
ncbi:hypothetical protein HYALB_00005421 [Hymenoscyphus albidus]|uniref:VASt domain-containing protein n=1 Tax=Hymenoscyphus albidus TaxID=595503 RepID=A0A9N9LAC9_9HELO|nr:hypothetical protein HYALB_00005421 [Hymenoscyphus albidus]